MDFGAIGYQISIWLLPILLAVTLHEAGHGFAARLLGDNTAYAQGRVTLNPLAHIDPFGTVILPGLLLLSGAGFLFGYAKPVPVNWRNLNNPKRDMMLVALAGPGTNFALALIGVALFPLAGILPSNAAAWLIQNLHTLIWFNLLLGVFNLLPIPPLDGGRVAVGLLPPRPAMALAKLERFGIFIVLGAFFLLPMLFGAIGIYFSPFQTLVLGPTNVLYNALTGVLG
ncbi:MAG: site-2 protease family protein [Sphingomonadales bacterium]|jgi:Zn-dependent protease